MSIREIVKFKKPLFMGDTECSVRYSHIFRLIIFMRNKHILYDVMMTTFGNISEFLIRGLKNVHP